MLVMLGLAERFTVTHQSTEFTYTSFVTGFHAAPFHSEPPVTPGQ